MADRNEMPEQQWLEVHTGIMKAWNEDDDKLAIDHLLQALRNLYLLLEPASVRELRRADDVVLEFVEGDE